eukprot:13317464-Alexandrium_andersonii.AAC.1
MAAVAHVRAPRLTRGLEALQCSVRCMGAALRAFGRALCLLALAGALALASRMSATDGGLKLHTWCAYFAPELFKE